MELTGKQRTAVLLLAMGDKFTADVFKRMDRQEIADISRAIVELEPVPREVVEEVLRDFHESLVEGVDMITGGSDTLKRLLVKNLDPETAKYVMDSLSLETGPAPFRELESVSPKLLSQILRNEHLPESYARVCERHTGAGLTLHDILSQNLPLPHHDLQPETIEEKLICYADKFFSMFQRVAQASMGKSSAS